MSNILRCNNCSSQLTVVGKDGPNFQVSCNRCGLNSNYITSAVRDSVAKGNVTIIRKRSMKQREEVVSSPYAAWR